MVEAARQAARQAAPAGAALALDGYSHPDQRCPGATAGIGPTPVHHKRITRPRGGLRRKNGPREHHIRTMGINLFERGNRQRGQIGRGHAETCNPSCRSIGMTDRFNQLEERHRCDFQPSKSTVH